MRLEQVIEAVSQVTGVPAEHIRGPRRLKSISIARQAVYVLARELTLLGVREIGQALNRNHSTIVKQAATARYHDVERVVKLARRHIKDN